jgi:hypothetical protein
MVKQYNMYDKSHCFGNAHLNNTNALNWKVMQMAMCAVFGNAQK